VLAVGLGSVTVASILTAVPAGATGSSPAPFTITVNGANSTSTTTSSVETLAWAGLPGDATGTVQFASGATVLCTATLPSTSCSSGTLAPGSYPAVTGTYSGDGTYAGSTSTNSVNLTVGVPGGTSLVCRKIFGYLTKVVTVAKCGVAQKGAHFAGGNLLTGGTLTWAKSKATTTYAGTATSPGQGACASGHTEYDFTGTVTGDTSSYVAVGDGVGYQVCVNATTQVVKLLNGTHGSF
jgi:hypothetical protein